MIPLRKSAENTKLNTKQQLKSYSHENNYVEMLEEVALINQQE